MSSLAGTAARTVIVVPCFNEANRFRSEAFEAFLADSERTDFLLVDDGSEDATRTRLEALAARHPGRIGVLALDRNRGKGEAVRQGILQAQARPGVAYVGYWDADLATPLSAIDQLAEVLDRRPDLDVILAARVQLLGRRIERKASRHYLGRVFATFASLTLSLPVYDTQCGAKLIRVGDRTRELFATPFGSRWIFDVEWLARYLARNGREGGIYELPLDHWRHVGGSKVRPVDFVRAIGELAQVVRYYRLPRRYHRWFDLLTAPFIRYSGAGAIGTALHYALLMLCVEGLRLAPATGAVVGAIGGALVNYWFNYHFTFVSAKRHTHTLPRFLTVAAIGVALNGWIVQLATTRFAVHYLLGQVFATLAVLVVGFVLNKLWTFGARG